MEKQHHPKSKNKILKFLPKAASAVYFQNQPFSPGRDKRLSEIHQHIHRVKPHPKGFSAPMIPDEVRRRSNSKNENSFEPTSPKISCMGQIKQKHKKKCKNHQEETNPEKSTTNTSSPRHQETKKQGFAIKRWFSNVGKLSDNGRRRSDASIYDKPPLTDTNRRAPSLSEMKRFASGRDTFANFDWSSQVAPEDDHNHHRNYDYSDEESDHDDEVIVPFSAAAIVGPLQPRKEINLWQRRTMNQPKPLQLK